jgi:hypothetical protein
LVRVVALDANRISPAEKLLKPVPPEVAARADARVSTPDEEKVDVAVLPKYAVPVFEKFVEDAPAVNDWRAVQLFASESAMPDPELDHNSVPEPSVVSDCPLTPSALGRTHAMFDAMLLGALNPT